MARDNLCAAFTNLLVGFRHGASKLSKDSSPAPEQDYLTE